MTSTPRPQNKKDDGTSFSSMEIGIMILVGIALLVGSFAVCVCGEPVRFGGGGKVHPSGESSEDGAVVFALQHGECCRGQTFGESFHDAAASRYLVTAADR